MGLRKNRDKLVGAGRFELPISCSQSRRASHYATPEAQSESLNQISYSDYRPSTFSPKHRGCSSMVEPQPSKLAMPVRSRSPAPVCLPDRSDLVYEGSASEIQEIAIHYLILVNGSQLQTNCPSAHNFSNDHELIMTSSFKV
jgi:hypothetical protein